MSIVPPKLKKYTLLRHTLMKQRVMKVGYRCWIFNIINILGRCQHIGEMRVNMEVRGKKE